MQTRRCRNILERRAEKKKRAKQIELSHDCLMSVIRTISFPLVMSDDQIKISSNDIVMQVDLIEEFSYEKK